MTSFLAQWLLAEVNPCIHCMKYSVTTTRFCMDREHTNIFGVVFHLFIWLGWSYLYIICTGTIIATISKIDDSSQRRKPMTHHHKVVKLPNFCGIHSGFVQDKEPNTLALVSTDNILVLALPDKCSLHSWISDLKSCTDFGMKDSTFIFSHGHLCDVHVCNTCACTNLCYLD